MAASTPMIDALPPGSVIGILGGGQLGRMLALAAAEIGYRTAVLAPKGDNPAFDVTWRSIEADYTDHLALEDFAGVADVVTYEFENVPAETASVLGTQVPLAPDPRILATTQDRAIEKRFLEGLGVPVAPWHQIDCAEDLIAARAATGPNPILKTRTLGYDGKGQVGLDAAMSNVDAWRAIAEAPAVLEGRVPFVCEISVIAARDRQGGFSAYEPGENHHENHILATTTVPARIRQETRGRAISTARRIAEALGYVGVFGVEFFVTGKGTEETLLVNEIAPRVHNSGHWTQDACAVSQFTQHVRCISGWPVATAERFADARMTNLLGESAVDPALDAYRSDKSATVHLYGKKDARSGRKMGHVTEVRPLGSTAISSSNR